MREAIFRTFSALASGNPVRDRDFAALNRALAGAPTRSRLARLDGGYAWRIEPAGISAPTLLAPVLWSAGDLMIKGEHRRVRQCANEKCLWLFVDESKNGTRRWCDMTACGNRAKARCHYLKRKGL
jgi:predicted RNA-binding Zn ribbon-like protein